MISLHFFSTLQEEFYLPRYHFYKYLQLRHVLQSHTAYIQMVLFDSRFISEVTTALGKKGMISHMYITLLSTLFKFKTQSYVALQKAIGHPKTL